jgi:hypothetical protein
MMFFGVWVMINIFLEKTDGLHFGSGIHLGLVL